MKTKVKNTCNKVASYIYYGKGQKDNFVQYSYQISKLNWQSADKLYVFGAVLTFLLSLISALIKSYHNYFLTYFSMFFISCLMLAVNNLYIKAQKKNNVLLYYLCLCMFATLIIVTGYKTEKTFCPLLISIILLVAPMFIIDKPFKLSLANIVVAITYFTIVYRGIAFENIALIAISLTLVCLLSILLIYYFTKFKLYNIANKEKLRKQRDTDFLTKLNTRGASEKVIVSHLNKADSLSVLLVMDLDNFKTINDNFGHKTGDEVLYQAAIIVKNFFAEKNYPARLGGDEFSIFIPNIKNREWVYDKCTELLSALKNGILIDNKQILTSSIGIAFSEDTQKTYEDMYKCADAALYNAKKQGKDTFAVYTRV